MLATFFALVSCLAHSSTLKIEATCSSETSVVFQRTFFPKCRLIFRQTTRRYSQEDRNLHNHRCENLKSYDIWNIVLPVCLSVYSSTVLLLDLGRVFSFVILYTVGLLGRQISPSQGRYLHTEQHNHRPNAHRHPCLEWDSNPRSQRSSERRQFMPYIARPLWSTLSWLLSVERLKTCLH
jgi:hypothetical protein